MTEGQWFACNDPSLALHYLNTRISERKQRLFAVCCCRRIEELILRFKGAYRAVVLAERIADGEPASDEAKALSLRLPEQAFLWIDGYRQEKENQTMWHAGRAAAGCLGGVVTERPFWSMPGPDLTDVHGTAVMAAGHWARRNDRAPVPEWIFQTETVAQAALMHCIFGNPFRPVAFSPAWRTDTAVALARTMYESREFGAMPILADALQDAGCDDNAILDHCRGRQEGVPGEPAGGSHVHRATHVRGCWVVDLVLGKE